MERHKRIPHPNRRQQPYRHLACRRFLVVRLCLQTSNRCRDRRSRPSFECLHRRNAGLHGSPIAAVGPTQPDRKRDRNKNAQPHEQPAIQPPDGKPMDRTGRLAHRRHDQPLGRRRAYCVRRIVQGSAFHHRHPCPTDRSTVLSIKTRRTTDRHPAVHHASSLIAQQRLRTENAKTICRHTPYGQPDTRLSTRTIAAPLLGPFFRTNPSQRVDPCFLTTKATSPNPIPPQLLDYLTPCRTKRICRRLRRSLLMGNLRIARRNSYLRHDDGFLAIGSPSATSDGGLKPRNTCFYPGIHFGGKTGRTSRLAARATRQPYRARRQSRHSRPRPVVYLSRKHETGIPAFQLRFHSRKPDSSNGRNRCRKKHPYTDYLSFADS